MKLNTHTFAYLLILFSVGLLGACQAAGTMPSGEPPTTMLPAATDVVGADTATSQPDTADDDDRQLVIWAPDFLSRNRDASAGQVIDAALAQFEQNHPNVRIEVQRKTPTGETSVFAYLRSAQRVAPDILPDIVLLDASELWQSAELGLIAPLSADEAAILSESYPFGTEGVAYAGQIWGVPYAADLIHAAYQRPAVDQPLRTWADLLASDNTYLFPAGSRDGYANDSVLLQYIGAGGQLLEDGTVSNPDALEAMFEFYLRGIEQERIPSEIEQYAGLNSVWQAFGEGRADMVDTSSTLVLSGSDPVAEIGYASVPTLAGESVTLANVWAFSIVSTDPDQRQLALELITTLLDPTVQGAWSQFVHRLPTQPDAFEQWASGSEYSLFLRDQMVPVAISAPNGRLFEQFTVRLQEALRGVLTGTITPAEAVLEVRAGP